MNNRSATPVEDPLADRAQSTKKRALSGSVSAVLVVLSLWRVAPAWAETSLAIGVISNSSTSIGQNHEDSIRFALSRYGDRMWAGGHEIRLVPIYVSDNGNSEEAVKQARYLVRERQVVAILGPVDSDSTQKVLQEDLGVPVLSALSTAPSLTDERDRWFFRVTLNDRDRMKQYVNYISQTVDLSSGKNLVLYDDTGQYGRGLQDALAWYLDPSTIQLKSWRDLTKAPTFDREWSDGLLRHPSLPAGVLESLSESPTSIFVLGPAEGSVAIARALLQSEHFKRRPTFFFVGSSKALLDSAPDGSFTIGDPVLDLRDSPLLKEQRADLMRLVTEFRDQSHTADNAFVVTAYEAAFYVLPDAIRRVVLNTGNPSDIARFRDELRAVLETETFASLTPWRKIHFEDGNLTETPPVPVFHAGREWARVDPTPSRTWVRLLVPKEARYPQGSIPITVEEGSLGENQAVDLHVFQLIEGEEPREVATERLAFTGGRATFAFQPPGTGTFSFKTANDVRYVPEEVMLTVCWSPVYALSVLGGLIGAILAISAGPTMTFGRASVRVFAGTVVSVGLTLLSFYGRSLPGWEALPIPSFGNAYEVNALATGFVGGYLGPGLINTVLRIPRPTPEETSAGVSARAPA